MLPTNEIFLFAKSLIGEDADTDTLSVLSATAAEELRGRLREGRDISALGQRFITAASILTLSLYAGIKDLGAVRSFQAGNVSVSYSGRSLSPDKLRQYAEQMLAGDLIPRGFGFRGVRG